MSNVDRRSVVFDKIEGVRPGIVEADSYTTKDGVSRIKSQVLEAFSATRLKEIKTKAGSAAESGMISYEDYVKILEGKPLVAPKEPTPAKTPTSPETPKTI